MTVIEPFSMAILVQPKLERERNGNGQERNGNGRERNGNGRERNGNGREPGTVRSGNERITVFRIF